jgi:hypothetical protein
LEARPSKGLKVRVDAKREAVFGEESVTVHSVSIPEGFRDGVLTGVTLAGFCEVDMPSLDKKKHWYPIDDLIGEGGEKLVEEEIEVDLEDDSEEDE